MLQERNRARPRVRPRSAAWRKNLNKKDKIQEIIGKGECFIEGDRFFPVPAHDVGKGVGLQHGRSAGLLAALFGGGDAFALALFVFLRSFCAA